MEVKKNYFLFDNKRWVIGSIILAATLMLPIIGLVVNFFSGDNSTFYYLVETVLLDYSLNTLYLVLITSFCALILGVIPAWFISNYKFKGRKVFDIVLYLPLAIPSYIMCLSLIHI